MPLFGTRRKQAQFAKLTQPHFDGLYRTALRMTGQGDAAEDLVQETCLKAYRAFQSYQSGTNYKAWLFTILTNTYIDTYARRQTPEFLTYEEIQEEMGHQSWHNETRYDMDPEAYLLQKTFRADALRALDRLDSAVRLVVTLALFEECSYEEIAQIIDCPIGTVRSRLYRGRQQLQRYLHEYALLERDDTVAR
jgi:RNA polymerase sigma-70 factor (ECF subfamily)